MQRDMPSQTAHPADGDAPEDDGGAPAGRPAPLTLPMWGRLFGVPLLIVGLVVGGAVTVVFLFGAQSAPQERSIEGLLSALEGSDGARSAGGVLLPQSKERWQAALEIGERLRKKDTELTPLQLDEVVARLASLVDTELGRLESGGVQTRFADGSAPDALRLEHLILALGRAAHTGSVPPLVRVVEAGHEPHRAWAIRQLADLKGLPAARAAVSPILTVLRDADAPLETRMIACTALSVLGAPDESAVVDGLAEAWRASDGELEWAAGMALARLSSDVGRSTFLDLLDRAFWEADGRYVAKDASGRLHRGRLAPQRVEANLAAAIDAASNLDDEDLWVLIRRLQSDDSLLVQRKANEAVRRRAAGGG